MFKLTTGNSKLGSIQSINLPPAITCRPNTPCIKKCYARKGHFMYERVKNCYEENLRMFLEEPEQTEIDILSQVPAYGMVRYHSSGDIVNMDYFDMMIRIAKKCKNIKFLCFTKKYELINEYLDNGNKIPKNLKIVFSGWVGLEMDNPYNLPTAYVEFKKGDADNRIKKNAFLCGGNCVNCSMCWLLKKGQQVLFHEH